MYLLYLSIKILDQIRICNAAEFCIYFCAGNIKQKKKRFFSSSSYLASYLSASSQNFLNQVTYLQEEKKTEYFSVFHLKKLNENETCF